MATNRSYEDILEDWLKLVPSAVVPDRATAESYAMTEYKLQGMGAGPSPLTAEQAKKLLEADEGTKATTKEGAEEKKTTTVKGKPASSTIDKLSLYTGMSSKEISELLLLMYPPDEEHPDRNAIDALSSEFGGQIEPMAAAMNKAKATLDTTLGTPETEGSTLGDQIAAAFGGTTTGGGYGGDYFPPSGYFDLQKWLMSGPETLGAYWDYLAENLPSAMPGEYWTGMARKESPLTFLSDMMSRISAPLTYEGDWADYLARGTFPQTYMPSTYYTQLGKSLLPQHLNMPPEFWGMMGDVMPQMVAPGATADFSALAGLGSPGNVQLGDFLASLVQSQPDLALQVMAAAQQMQQEAAMPFLALLLSQTGAAEGATAFPVGSEQAELALKRQGRGR